MRTGKPANNQHHIIAFAVNCRQALRTRRRLPIVNCLLCFVMIFSSCSPPQVKKDDRIVARTKNKVLYFSEMSDIFPKGSTGEDSLSLASLFIDNWIKTQLILEKAKLNLSPEEADISREIEMYSTSLLIYKYEEQLLREKLDTVVPVAEMQAYYERNTNSFLLKDYAVKALYLKIPADAPRIDHVKRWYTSSREKDIEELTRYGYNYALRFEYFNDEWIPWTRITSELPQREAADRQISLYNKIEQEDNGFIYLAHIRDKKKPGEVAPLELVKSEVKSIIINKRKLKFISELERNIYNDALAKKQFEIYKLNN
jgi:hypothetical protein